MANILSQDIKVFPSTKRGTYQRSSRLISEENLTNIVNKLIDKDSFVIRPQPYNSLGTNDQIQFNIHGYYFSVPHIGSITTVLSDSAESIYANIITDTETVTVDNITYEYTELQGQDTGSASSTYTGVSFTADAPDTGELTNTQTRYSLKILERASSTQNVWQVPYESMYKYEAQNVFGDISLIDGGVV